MRTAIFVPSTREHCSPQVLPEHSPITPGGFGVSRGKMSARFENVPVVEVSADNFAELWPFMVRAIKKSSFVALDTVRE